MSSSGELYGTALQGGVQGFGAVFKISPPGLGRSRWTETLLYSFGDGLDGGSPISSLTFDSQGALYGTTNTGGANGMGTVFKLKPPVTASGQWTLTSLYQFDGTVGANAAAGVIFDSSGALYGTARGGGASGGGAVFKLTPPATPSGQWTATAIYNFTGGADGANPLSQLIMDTGGALYGSTQAGGSGNGVVFQLRPSGAACAPNAPNFWCETVLYSFGGSDGAKPNAGVVMDTNGALFGATLRGGAENAGVVFRLNPPVSPSMQWTESVLHSFSYANGDDGIYPYAPLTLMGGAIYGTTYGGGKNGFGAVFQIRPAVSPSAQWVYANLYSFTGGADGGYPMGGVMFGAPGFGFGLAAFGVTSYYGPTNNGTVYTLECVNQVKEVFGGTQHSVCAP
ncbi:choice-of-anchor tandem repeat GloVer-containing protein [Methylocystis heyeri]|uniref:Uncharacterized protein n=1 Tax=Methylocystis heyeri TaxID=391905 RepID=A0A6B8KF74_9HYPH|nr:choice-of-anchor tandem repeat GloVer-containing protein [Methylocystis heyeri]QGM46299.1 hypothetical protein H2LOC_011660 [Methylocystis heyeri]